MHPRPANSMTLQMAGHGLRVLTAGVEVVRAARPALNQQKMGPAAVPKPIRRHQNKMKQKSKNTNVMMPADKFWAIIDTGKNHKHPEVFLLHELLRMSVQEIIQFQNRFDAAMRKAFRWDMWAAADVINGGCSDDGFEDFLHALIALGREAYESAVRNPDSLADLDFTTPLDNEGFGYAAAEAYEVMTGGEDIYDLPRNGISLHPPGNKQIRHDLSMRARAFPKLCAKYASTTTQPEDEVADEQAAYGLWMSSCPRANHKFVLVENIDGRNGYGIDVASGVTVKVPRSDMGCESGYQMLLDGSTTIDLFRQVERMLDRRGETVRL